MFDQFIISFMIVNVVEFSHTLHSYGMRLKSVIHVLCLLYVTRLDLCMFGFCMYLMDLDSVF